MALQFTSSNPSIASTATPMSAPSAPMTAASSPPSIQAPVAIHFTTVPKLFDAINNTTGDILTVQGVSREDFDKIKRARERRRRGLRFRRYTADTETLIITIPSAPHELLHTYPYNEIRDEIVRMGLRDEWETLGATELQTGQTLSRPGGDGGGSGEGDSTGGPLSHPRGLVWPTLVIEAGYSETIQALRNDMRWWFAQSNHEVQIVLLTKFDAGQRQITIEKWVEVSAPSRPGATTTRAAAAMQRVPSCTQTIIITRLPGSAAPNPTSYTVIRNDLRLEFELLFLRQPQLGEGDIIVSTTRLQLYAARVWIREEARH